VSATAVSQTEIALTWNSATDNITSSSNIVYLVYISTTSGGQNFETPISSVTGGTSTTISGLTAGTTYYFIVRARDENNNTDTNSIERFAATLIPPDIAPPAFGGLVSATAVSQTEIALTWNSATDNVTSSSNIVYLIYMSTTSGGQNFSSASFSTSAGATSFTVPGLNPNTTYYFVVRAKDEANNTDTNVIEISATTFAPPDTAHPTFGGLALATVISTSQIALFWNPATDNVTTSSNIVYLIYMSTTSGGQNFETPNFTTSPGATSFFVPGLNPNTTYYFVVRARDQAGNHDSNTIEMGATIASEIGATIASE